MNYKITSEKLAVYRREISALRQKMRETLAAVEPEEVTNYGFTTPEGAVRLSELFGGKDTLFVILNMGASCRYCTLWADGYNGVYDHLADRAAFVVSSPDLPATQRRFAQSRGWRFPMVSHRGTSFAADMGYRSEGGGFLPGIVVFRGDKGRVFRVSDTGCGPGDDFCSVWHFFDLLPEGADGWQPGFRYA